MWRVLAGGEGVIRVLVWVSCCVSCLGAEVILNWGFEVYPPVFLIVGDTLVFEYHPFHNVWDFPNRKNFEQCDFGNSRELGGLVGPFQFTAEETGTYFFGCEVVGHCTVDDGGKQGLMKVEVKVAAPGCFVGDTKEADEFEDCLLVGYLCRAEVTRDCANNGETEADICQDTSYSRGCVPADECGDLATLPCRETSDGTTVYIASCCCDASSCNRDLPEHGKVPLVSTPANWNFQESESTRILRLGRCDVAAVLAVGEEFDVGTPCETLHLFPNEQAFDECDFGDAEIVAPHSTADESIRWEYRISEDISADISALYFGCETFCEKGLKLVILIEEEGTNKCDVSYPIPTGEISPQESEDEERREPSGSVDEEEEEEFEEEIEKNTSARTTSSCVMIVSTYICIVWAFL